MYSRSLMSPPTSDRPCSCTRLLGGSASARSRSDSARPAPSAAATKATPSPPSSIWVQHEEARSCDPEGVALHARRYGQSDWLDQLSDLILELADRWWRELGEPFAGRSGISRVAPAGEVDGLPVVLKVGMPHREGRTEPAGLEFSRAERERSG